jgi:hypothetical protein
VIVETIARGYQGVTGLWKRHLILPKLRRAGTVLGIVPSHFAEPARRPAHL